MPLLVAFVIVPFHPHTNSLVDQSQGPLSDILYVPLVTKLATAFSLVLPPRGKKLPAYRWLYHSLRAEILQGRLRPGTRLPSTRDLAIQYGLARGTIVNAFDQLRSEGYVDGTVGSGTYVSKVLPERLLHVASLNTKPQSTKNDAAKAAAIAEKPLTKRPALSLYTRRLKLFEGFADRPTRAFRPNLPALDLFPIALWAKITARCLRQISRRHLMGCGPLGHLPLRHAIAEYLTTSRGVRCAPEQVAIVSGVQEALDFTARLLLNPGDRVCLESPGYPGAALAFRAFRANIRHVRVDDDGILVRHLPSREVRNEVRSKVRLVYVTPAHQFPLGTTMSLARRLELLEWARKSGAVIFEEITTASIVIQGAQFRPCRDSTPPDWFSMPAVSARCCFPLSAWDMS